MWRLLYSALLLLAVLLAAQWAQAKTTQLKETPEFIFAEVLKMKNLERRDEVIRPTLHLASQTSLKDFQDAIESQWNFRPDIITNAFAIKTNQIFLLDDSEYYEKTGRCIDDSLAHEYVHFLQHAYQKYDLNDENLEMEAIDIQSRFREAHCH